MALNKAEKAIRSKVPDNTLWGQILFGILDSLPLANIHEV